VIAQLSSIPVEVARDPRVEPPDVEPGRISEPAPAPAPARPASLVVEAEARAPAAAGLDAVALERLWLATQRARWTSLALVPVGPGVPTARLAEALSAVGTAHLGTRVAVRDCTTVSLASLQDQLARLTRRAARVILALPRLADNPAGLVLARAADAAVLCVALGSSEIAEAEQLLAEVGKERLLGTVILGERKVKP
jgi:hypothetical protein